MGLDTSHDCWNGPYSSFAEFRREVAAAALIHYGYAPNYEGHPERAFYGWWDKDHDYADVLDVFFVHSDCEGYIFPRHARPLADRLEALVDHLDGEGPLPVFTPRRQLRRFVDGLRRADDEWEVVVFH